KAHFSYYLAGQRTRGFIPIESAGLMLDLDAPQGAEIIVNFNVARARAGNVLATSALREEKVLNIKSFPNARFVSRRIMRLNDGVRVTGDFTLRGETREMDLDISLLRDGRADAEPSILRVVGQFDRREYGADGYPWLVDPMIELDFQLEIIPLR
ncbi:MAG: YceI family protein, partial [Halocynthiibacter sp.]